MTDSRYPYTHSCDFIRRLGPVGSSGVVLSRSNASQIRQGIADAIGVDDHELACKLADRFLQQNGLGEVVMIDHSMQPLPEQFADWLADAIHHFPAGPSGEVAAHVARKAYAAGADAELEACCRLLDSGEHAASYGCHDGNSLREARRPKVLSLKEQAQQIMDEVGSSTDGGKTWRLELGADDLKIIRQALLRLPD